MRFMLPWLVSASALAQGPATTAARILVGGKPWQTKAPSPPALDPEPEATPVEPSTFEVKRGEEEVFVLARPWYGAPMVGALAPGARVHVAARVESRGRRFCGGNFWLKLAPQAYVCSVAMVRTDAPPDAGPVLVPRAGSALPFAYVMVTAAEGVTVPLYATVSDAAQGLPAERPLSRGDTVAVAAKPLSLSGEGYWESVDGRALPRAGTSLLKEKSAWQGEVLAADARLPFGWSLGKVRVFSSPDELRRGIGALAPRERVEILEESGERTRRMVRIGEGRWVRSSEVNEVRAEAAPASAIEAQWIDVDLGEQVLVAYRGARAEFATLISSGRQVPTPRGDYPIWAKVSTITMKNQPYEEQPYFVHQVPWVMFFQAHNALHGAYWHDRFGRAKSHGCVNLSPRDARFLFEWVQPALRPGWTGSRPIDLREWPIVHVRNSRLKRPWAQERPIGRPDKELEQLRLQEAGARRAAMGAGSVPVPSAVPASAPLR